MSVCANVFLLTEPIQSIPPAEINEEDEKSKRQNAYIVDNSNDFWVKVIEIKDGIARKQ